MAQRPDNHKSDFYLDKWFLDLTTDEGEAMIFYAAELVWKEWRVPYTSWLRYQPGPDGGVSQRSRLRNVQIPQRVKNVVTWSDKKFGVAGEWKGTAPPLQARLFHSEEGYLDWKCFQPASEVELSNGDIYLKGKGYVEQLILTAPPWKIPMNELRWGRFGSEKDYLVWVELREKKKQQWLWWNGVRVANCSIEDSYISLSDYGLTLELDRAVQLEGERKISKVVGDMIKYLPGFDKVMPLKFLMTLDYKWLSKARFQSDNGVRSKGFAIHELVRFNSGQP